MTIIFVHFPFYCLIVGQAVNVPDIAEWDKDSDSETKLIFR